MELQIKGVTVYGGQRVSSLMNIPEAPSFHHECSSLACTVENVFDTIPIKNVASWNAMIGCYGKHGRCSASGELQPSGGGYMGGSYGDANGNSGYGSGGLKQVELTGLDFLIGDQAAQRRRGRWFAGLWSGPLASECSILNPRPGVIINSSDGEDVYAGVPKDYNGEQVIADNLYAVILGDRKLVKGGSGKVVNSGPNDRIFIYYSDHGGPEVLGMPDMVYVLLMLGHTKKWSRCTLRMSFGATTLVYSALLGRFYLSRI